MTRPSPAILGSIAVHAAVVALALFSWPRAEEARPPVTVSSVPVTIVSDMVIEAAAPDNPSEELVAEDAATAPPPPDPAPPEPAPPVPTPPAPTPRPVEKAPPPRPTPPRPTPARPTPPKAQPTPPRPTPPRPTPPRPAPRREEPTLDLEALAGPRRPATPGPRAPTGQQGQGRASQATGPQITAIFNQVYPNWVLNCDVPGANELRIQVELTLSPTGRITAGPTLLSPRSDPVWRAAADNAVRALRATAPFDVPEGFPGGPYRPTFNTERACRNR